MPYPTVDDLKEVIQGGGMELRANIDYEDLLGEAARCWEGDTGWTPFLAADRTQTVDGPGAYSLYPEVGVLSLTALSVNGTPLAQGTDYRLALPRPGGPYLEIRFARFVSESAIVAFSGRIGYQEALDARARAAVIRKAAILYSASHNGPQGALVREQYRDVRYEYAGGARESGTQVAQWQAEYDKAVEYYQRVGVG